MTTYPLKVGCIIGTTTTTYVAGVTPSITFSGVNVLLPAPNYAAIQNANGLVVVSYTELTGNTISGLTVIEADSPASLTATYGIGSEISRPITKADFDQRDDMLLGHMVNTDNPHGVTATQIGLASTTNLGTIKVGDGLSITEDGTLSATGGGGSVQSDWEQEDETQPDYIKNKPTNVSAFTNDAGYQTETDVLSEIEIHNVSTTSHQDIREEIDSKISVSGESTDEFSMGLDSGGLFVESGGAYRFRR